MTMPLGLIIKPLAFLVVSAPMLLDAPNDTIRNRDNVAVLAAGLGMLALGGTLGLQGFALPRLSAWVLVAIVPILAWRFGSLGGGAAKLFVALLPWFAPGAYIVVIISGMLAEAFVLKRLWRDLRLSGKPSIAPAMIVMALFALVQPLLRAWR